MDCVSKVAVIGHEGFVGSALSSRLSDAGYNVVGVKRGHWREAAKSGKFELLVICSTNSSKVLAENDPRLDYELTVSHVTDALSVFQYDRVLLVSSGEVYKDKTFEGSCENIGPFVDDNSPYGYHKLLAENLVLQACERPVILRMGGFLGEGLKKNLIFDLLKSRTKKIYVTLDSTFQFLGTDNTAQIVIDLLRMDELPKVMNLSGVGSLSVREVISFCGIEIDEVSIDNNAKFVKNELNTCLIRDFVECPSSLSQLLNFVEARL